MSRSASQVYGGLAVVALLAFGACNSPGSATGLCRAGWIASCACENGAVGQHVCDASGQFGVCDCGTSNAEPANDTSGTSNPEPADDTSGIGNAEPADDTSGTEATKDTIAVDTVPSEDGDATTTNNTNTTNTTETVQDEIGGSNYIAVIVSDENKFEGTCQSTTGGDGADIDAVELADDQDNNLGGFEYAKLVQGTSCNMLHNNIDDVKGMHNGTLTQGYVSLGGGYVIGVFQSEFFIADGYVITVYEIGDAFCPGGVVSCIGNEAYEVALADSINCGGANASCAQPLGDSAGGMTNIPVDLTGF